MEGFENHPLLGQGGRRWRHGAWPYSADLSVVGTARHIAQKPALTASRRALRRPHALAEHRGDHRHVGQMRSAVGRVVGDHRVAGLHCNHPAHLAHAKPQRSQMHRDVRRVDHQPPLGVEHGTGKIEPFLDVGRQGRAPQHLAHLARDGGEAVGEQAEREGVRWRHQPPAPRRRSSRSWRLARVISRAMSARAAT